MKKIAVGIWGIFLLAQVANAQATKMSNTVSFPSLTNGYLGWDAATTVPLEIRTTGVNRIRIPSVYSEMLGANGATTYPIRAGNVGIGNLNPSARLHVGSNITVNGGYRDWMNIGTLYSNANLHMYVGLKQFSSVRDAVINWGDGASTASQGSRMRFIYTSAPGVGQPGTSRGLELGHFWTDGTNPRLGVGDFQTPNLDPGNTLEIRSSDDSLPPAGLRFSNLDSDSDTIPNPAGPFNPKVLSVNGDGDVVLVPDNRGDSITAHNGLYRTGNDIRLGGPLTETTIIDQAGFNTIFTGAGRVGIGTTNPGARLHTNGTLLFQNLPPGNLSFNRVLVTDVDGNVAWRDASTFGGGGTGGGMSAENGLTPNTGTNKIELGGPLLHHTVIDQANSLLSFTGTGGNSRIAIGLDGFYSNSSAKVHIDATGCDPAIDAHGGSQGGVFTGLNLGLSGKARGGNDGWIYGLHGAAYDATQFGYGVYGESSSTVATINYGLFGAANGSSNTNIGVWAKADGGATCEAVVAYAGSLEGVTHAVRGNASGSVANYGGHFYGHGSPTGLNYGVWGYASDGNHAVGVYGEAASSPNALAGQFAGNVAVGGDVQVSGTLTTTTLVVTSDNKFKTNVGSFSNGLNIIRQLSPKTYDFDTKSYPQFRFSEQKQYGLIAQEVEKIIPELVCDGVQPAVYDSLGRETSPRVEFKGVNYIGFVPILVEAMKEQQGQIEAMATVNANYQSQLDHQQKLIDSLFALLKSGGAAGGVVVGEDLNTTAVQLNDVRNIVLNQNVPNPFAEETSITYFVPEHVKSCKIIFTDQVGNIIKTVDILEKGAGKLHVFANDLSSGTYTYSIVADGKTLDSKKMIKIK